MSSAFLRLESIMTGIGDCPPEAKMRVLEGIFALNNEIGKLLMARPELGERLTELQLMINAVTAAIKRSDLSSAQASFEVVRHAMQGFTQS